MFVLEDKCSDFDKSPLERAAQIKASPVPDAKTKKAQLNLQCPSL